MMNQVNTIRPTETPSIETEKGGFTVNKFVPLGVLAAGGARGNRNALEC